MSTSTPAYRQIEAWLRELLPCKSEGDLLPTINELCERFDVSGVQTVRNAYQPLVEEGWVRVQHRPQRRWVVAQVPPRIEQPTDTTVVLARIARIEEALRSALRELDALKADVERP